MIDALIQSKNEQKSSNEGVTLINSDSQNAHSSNKLLLVALLSISLMSCGGQNTGAAETSEPKVIEENAENLDKANTNTTTTKAINSSKDTIEVSPELLVLAEVEAGLQKSLKANDYRILATSGRRTTYPGVDVSEYDFVKSKCEDRFMPETSDAIKSPEDREARRKIENYMKLYNQRMLVHCKANKG